MTFQIYDPTTGAQLYTSAPKAFAADASATTANGTFKKSDLFTFTFEPGTTYAVGAIVDNVPFVITTRSTKSQNGIHALTQIQYVTDGRFSTHLAVGGSIAAQFFAGEVAAVPEPMTWSLMIVGFGLVGAALRCQSRTLPRYR